MPPRDLTGLLPQAYEHPSDAAALNALQHVTGLGEVISKLNAWSFDRLLRVELTGSYLQVTPDSFPDLDELLTVACRRLDMPARPDLYIGGSGVNAFTACVERPLILVYSGAVEHFSAEELLFVLAHELGHIKSAHVLYYQTAEFFPIIGEIIGSATLGLGDLVFRGMQVALMHWKRMAEFTADRAGLLACQDTDVALRTMMKLAGLPRKYFSAINTEDFIRQAQAFQAMDTDKLSMMAKWLNSMDATHPYTVMRAQQMLEWIQSGDYQRVLSAPQSVRIRMPAGVSGFCNKCGSPLKGSEIFCPNCGDRKAQFEAAHP